ncbi:hypothetical protein PC9H_000674 [Pleurotus ostreatus]|uniref:DUF1783-domain-containing protein n=1 Tax=Pleurotus ostreatus TaxID=5322 RepID=A0A8H7DX17_PLEOS|nr:uncharacterized protein PC9H_000674 [Pleurotus ostreatus]KAF7440330.1 hypothetical protein PC9H_000674 [Pleurotus ostreatus]
MSFLARRAHAHTPLRVPRRAYATETHRPRPEPSVETFSSPARLRPYRQPRDLPLPKKKWPVILAAVTGGVLAWSAFLTYITNQEKISSSVVRQIMRSVKESVELRDHLGEAIRPQPEWWLNGDPRIKGNINQLQGNVDVSLRLKGSKDSGTLYFTSIRKEKGVPFTILRFKVICDDGSVVHISSDPI